MGIVMRHEARQLPSWLIFDVRQMKATMAALAIACGVTSTLADSPVRKDPKAVASPKGQFFMLVTLVDSSRRSWIWTTYRMENIGAFKEVWSSDGTWSSEIFLADDGASVACVESRPYGLAPKDDLLVAIFKQGKLVKAYRAQDLIENLESVQRSTSHYRWLAEDFRPRLDGVSLRLETIEGRRFSIDVTSGVLTRIDR